jgi:hypothetical protein
MKVHYVHHGTWAHLTVNFIQPSHPSVCVSVCVFLLPLLGKGSVKCILPFIARQQLGKDVPMATKNFWSWHFLCSPHACLNYFSFFLRVSSIPEVDDL